MPICTDFFWKSEIFTSSSILIRSSIRTESGRSDPRLLLGGL